ncbi:MAG TPA: hypothetical protein VF741_03280, partial [Candidatus Aquilonibacter sp.]
VWGLASGAFNLLAQLVIDARLPVAALWAVPVIYLTAIGLSIWLAYVEKRDSADGRKSLLQREFLNVLWLTISMAFISNLIGFHIFTQWAMAAVWTVAGSIVLLYIGMHGNRRALIGAVVMIASLAVANFELPFAGYALGCGFVLGYAGFGLADILARE